MRVEDFIRGAVSSDLVGELEEYNVNSCDCVFIGAGGEAKLWAFRQEIDFLGVELASEVGD